MANDSYDLTAASLRSIPQQTWWHKPAIWAAFLLLVYLLREFFLIGFLTFLFCFVIRSLVGVLMRRFASGRESHRLETLLTLALIFCICIAMYGLGRFFLPSMIREGKSLAMQLRNLSVEEVQNALLSKTVGAWEFNRQFGSPKNPRYQKAFNQFLADGRNGEGLYQTFPSLHSKLQAEFEANYEQSQVVYLQSLDPQGASASGGLQKWFLETKAPELFSSKSDYYIARWEAEHASPDKTDALETLKKQSDYETRRDEQIRQQIWTDIRSDPVLFAEIKTQWAQTVSIQAWDKFRESSEYQTRFKDFFASQAENIPIDYSLYQTLVAAYPKGKQVFLDAVRQHDNQEKESPAHQQFDFESTNKLELGQQWWATSHSAAWCREHIAADGPKVLEAVAARFDKALNRLLRIPIQIVTALLLSFFMLIEWDGVKTGVVNLRDTRVRPIYDEVAPGIVALGKLVGKSFQGQVVIAFINACLTLAVLWFIGVEYKFILALMVFLFSFIPVVGVILSGIPICTIAILQPGGSLWMVLQVIVAMAMIHLIEGMVLSPRIIGKIGHLHPVLVIVILLIAEKFFGIWGLVLGVPVAIYLIRVVILDSPIPGIYEPSGAANLSTEIKPQN